MTGLQGACWTGIGRKPSSPEARPGAEDEADAASPKDGFSSPYGDYFEIDINAAGGTVALWGEGFSWTGPGNIWFARQT